MTIWRQRSDGAVLKEMHLFPLVQLKSDCCELHEDIVVFCLEGQS